MLNVICDNSTLITFLSLAFIRNKSNRRESSDKENGVLSMEDAVAQPTVIRFLQQFKLNQLLSRALIPMVMLILCHRQMNNCESYMY